MKICYSSDLHGDEHLYRQLLDLVKVTQPDLLLLGGDNCAGLTVVAQKAWLDGFFRRFLRHLRPMCPIIWASGNHDWAASSTYVQHFATHNTLINTDNRWVELLGNWHIAGFPFGPISGATFKDWERADLSQTPNDWIPELSNVSHNGIEVTVRTHEYVKSAPTLSALLSSLLATTTGIDWSHTILLSHYPPYESGLDQGAFGEPIGSKALAAQLIVTPIGLALHGHVHESPYISGVWTQVIGSTFCVNPGQYGTDLHAILFETDDIPGTLTHTVFGKLGEDSIPYRDPVLIRQQIEQMWSK